ncbi:DUF3347 domain-containing protein [Phaeodactylibacter xiamenensis]|jgi:hypothetical protein|uniref:DUF3347 domain-containing protein n=1 Tax=Phaeodactylibacter xiamenensis TaxID=1524460 RepID=UPI0005C70F59|nr:DUF3347 domain-containing protein [Phaeodactylibacter xiamenensis]
MTYLNSNDLSFKIRPYLIGLVALVFLFTACNGETNTNVERNSPVEVKSEKENTPDSFDASFADGITEAIFQDYLHLRTAFVHADMDEAKAVARELIERLTAEESQALSAAKEIADAQDIEKQRAAFYQLSEALAPIFEEGLTGGTIYEQYCPMAFDNQGASWFSDSKEIRNPYFGDKMLTCGKVKRNIQ